MNIELENINKLPVRTWSWLGVNDTSLQENIPDIKPYQKNPIKSDIAFLNTITAESSEHIKQMELPDTGSGKEAAEFVKANQNAGISIKIPAGMKIKEPVYLEYTLDENNSTVVDFNWITAEEDSEVTVVMVYRSIGQETAFHGGLTYMNAGENAVINLFQIQILNDRAVHLNNIGANFSPESKINIVQAELGGNRVVNGINGNLDGYNSRLDINTIFFGDKKQTLDFNYKVNHMGKKSKCEMEVNGALQDESSKIFRGTIDFKKGAAGAVGHEKEYTLLFGQGIKNVSAPLILCGEDEVEGKHAANSGKIDENKLFYMMSRGLDEQTAKKLILEAWFMPVISKIPYDFLQSGISDYMKERLNYE